MGLTRCDTGVWGEVSWDDGGHYRAVGLSLAATAYLSPLCGASSAKKRYICGMNDVERMFPHRRVVVGITGASGAVYGLRLVELLQAHQQVAEVVVVLSDNGRQVWAHELGPLPSFGPRVRVEDAHNLFADVASGSALFGAMAIAPCSMGTLGRIAHGVGDNLICRAAEVALKERRRLVVLAREAPLSLIHIESMRQLTLAGGVVCPACPTFYGHPRSADELVLTVVERVIDLMGLPIGAQRWEGGGS